MAEEKAEVASYASETYRRIEEMRRLLNKAEKALDERHMEGVYYNMDSVFHYASSIKYKAKDFSNIL